MNRKSYFVFRTAQTVLLLWFLLTFLFFFFRLMPGSFTDIMLQQGASEEAVAAFRQQWGLNDPLYIQYFRYLANFLQFNFGTSIQFRTSVIDHVGLRIFNSFILIAPAITVAYILGSTFGTVLGTQRGSALEKHGLVPFILFASVPSFFLAIVAVVVFSGWLGWFPSFGMITPDTYTAFRDAPFWRPYLTGDFLSHYVLPFCVIILRYTYLPLLIMRTSVVETIGQEFTFYHRLSGLPKSNQLRHIAKHSILPVVTLYPVSMTRAIGGLVLIESVFNWPGIGFTLVQAVLARDFPVVQFVFFLVAAFIIVANFAVDTLYGVIDPRVSVDA
jgi:peptide/nickel transport system permease protein